MPTPEEKYYRTMNTLLTPARFAIDGLEGMLIFAIFIFLGIAYPFLQLCNEEPLTLFSFLVPIMTFLGVISLFYTPIYTILTGIACTIVFFSPAFAPANAPEQDFVGANLTADERSFILIGLLTFGILVKLAYRGEFNTSIFKLKRWIFSKRHNSIENQKRLKMEAEEVQKRKEKREERKREHERKRSQAEAVARQRFRAENKEIFTEIRNLLSNCATPAVEIMRAVGALEGKELEANPKHVVWLDVGFILASVRRTGSGIEYIDKLWEEVTRAIKLPDVDGLPLLEVVPNRGVEQLGLVSLLVEYDTQQGTDFTSKAASVYRRIVTAVCDHCDGSLAAKMVADKYIELLNPSIHDNGRNEYTRNLSSSAGDNSNRKPVCERCSRAFRLLDLPLGATRDEVEQKRRDFAQVFHTDRLGSMSEGVRGAAVEHLKSINAACDQILRCPSCARSTS